MYSAPSSDGLLYRTHSPAWTVIALTGIDVERSVFEFDVQAAPEDHMRTRFIFLLKATVQKAIVSLEGRAALPRPGACASDTKS